MGKSLNVGGGGRGWGGKNNKRKRNGSQRGDTKRKEKESLPTSSMLIADKKLKNQE